jgi:preprotein translocase subunit SecA
MRSSWGKAEWIRLANTQLADLEPASQLGLRKALGDQAFDEYQQFTIENLPASWQADLIDELGRQSLTKLYRQLLLSITSELWVEYLTEMEALRVSIGLEAYAQRDPLVQYKNRAFELFQNLLSSMRMGVLSRMFIYQPRILSPTAAPSPRDESRTVEPATAEMKSTGQGEIPNENETIPVEVEASELNQVPTSSSSPIMQPTQSTSARRRHKRKKR